MFIEVSFYLITLPFHNIVKCFIHLNYFPNCYVSIKRKCVWKMYMHISQGSIYLKHACFETYNYIQNFGL